MTFTLEKLRRNYYNETRHMPSLNQMAVLIMILFALVLGVAIVLVSAFFGRVKRDPNKLSVYECGVPPTGSARQRYSVKFYLIAIFFLIFDIEVVFMYPWALIFKSALLTETGLFLMIEMGIFISILLVGYIYIWKKRGLEWD